MNKPDLRKSPLRRQFNSSFCDPDGNLSWSKTIAAWGQVAALYHFGKSFDLLIDKPETMAIILAFIIAPETIKKFLNMKYGVAK